MTFVFSFFYGTFFRFFVGPGPVSPGPRGPRAPWAQGRGSPWAQGPVGPGTLGPHGVLGPLGWGILGAQGPLGSWGKCCRGRENVARAFWKKLSGAGPGQEPKQA